MKKLLIALLFVPFILSAQTPTPLVDLSKYHDDNRIKEMIDNNFTNITNGTYQFTDFNYDPPTKQIFPQWLQTIEQDSSVIILTPHLLRATSFKVQTNNRIFVFITNTTHQTKL